MTKDAGYGRHRRMLADAMGLRLEQLLNETTVAIWDEQAAGRSA